MKRAFNTVRGLTALLLLVVTACALVLSPAAQSEAPAVLDPLPIRRVALTPEKLVSELEKAKRGVLVQMPRVEFDALVRRAAETSAALKNPPRLVEARYVAKLEDTELEGYAEWKILNPADRAGILPVAPFNLAIQKVHWPENQRAAVLGELDGKELGLLVDAPGPSSLYLDWSARSIPTGNGLRYSLEMPACAIATLELDLPADRAVVISRDTYLLAGPLPAADAKRRTWRLGFAGRSAVTFDVRRVQGPDIPPPLMLSKLQTRQELTPGQLQADFDFEVEVPRGPVTELRCAFAPVLRPYEVAIRNLESWEVRPAGTGKTATLIVKLREPFSGGPLQVRCLAPLLSEKNWTAPGVALLNAVPRGETLVLRVHPGVVLEDWQPGGFRLSRSIFQPDGWQVLTLAAGVDAGADPVRPGARIQTPGPEFRVRQQTWWQIDSDKPLLTAQLHYEIAQGRLFSLPLTLPPNWEVEHVELTPPDLLQHWNVQQEKGKATLLVDLHRPLELNAGARLTVRARPTQAFRVASSGSAVPIPDIVPLGARLREGALGVSVASLFQASANASLTAVPVDAADETRGRAPWGKAALDFHFPYQGQPVEGALLLRPRTPQVRARCLTDVVVTSGRALAMNRLELAPDIGNPQALDFLISGPTVEWEWKTVRGSNGVLRFERCPDAAPLLAVLAARTPLGALALLNAPRPGALWRLTLTQPLREPITLEAAIELTDLDVSGGPALSLLPLATMRPLGVVALVAAGPALADQAARQRRWDVPLVSVPAAERFSGQVTLHLGGADLVQVTSTGLREIVDAPRPDGPRGSPAPGRPFAVSASSTWRTFRYAHPPVALSLRGSMPQADRSGEAVADHASLSSTLGPDGRLIHQYRVQVHHWQQPTLPIQLPPGVRLEAVRVDGRWLMQLPASVEVNGMTQHELPVTAGAGPHQIDVIYATELPGWSLWTTLEAPAPELPLPVVMLRRVWRLPPGVAPLRGDLLLRLPGVDLDGASFVPAESTDWAPRQEQQLADAVAALRKQRGGDDWPLGTVLERLAIDQRKDRPLVVDALALQAAGIRRSTALGAKAWEGAGAATLLAGPWEAAGLVHIGCRPAPLLTTRQQLAAWKTAPGMVVAARSLEEAVAEAVAEGHDRSGRFRTVIDWLQLPDAVEGTGDVNGPAVLAGLESGVTEWEPLAGADAGAPLTVVRQDMVPVVGLVLAALVCIAALRFAPQTERKRRRLILIWLAATGLVLLWLPAGLRPLLWGPVLGGLGVAVLWLVRPLRVIAGAPSTILRAPGAPVAASGLVLLAAALLPGQAALAPTVYLLPDGGQPDKQLVLAPPQLLNQLQALERRGVGGLRQAVLLSAVYKGRVEGGAAHLEATFQLHSFADDAVVTLPLTNIQLTEAHLDGAPAHLGKNYALRIAGKGAHVVALRFTTVVGTVGDERELRCGIPELPYSRLTLRVPAPRGYLYAVESKGAQTTTVDGANLRLAADLGAVKQLAARWHREEPQQPAVSVREAYYWNLQASAARLLAVWQYTMIRGWQQNFELDVPPELDVQSVEARNPPDGPAAPLLLAWSLRGPANGVRRLKLEFQLPVTQSVQVTLEFVPRQPFGARVNLPFPTPIDARQGQGFLAYRTDGIEAQVTQTLAIAGDRKEVLARAFADWLAGPWRKAREEDLAEPTQSFWRTKGGALHLSLGTPPQGRCWQEVAWKVGQRQAAVRAAVKLTGDNLSLIQWEVPGPLAVVEVSGQHVHHWTRSGGRIQVWLQRPVTETTLQLIGWLPRPAQEQAQFNLPSLRILDMEKQSATVRVAAGDGLVLQPGKLANLTLRPDPTTAGREWTYDADQDGYRATFQTSPATASVDFKLLTFAEAQDREMRFTAQLHGVIRRGELRHLTVALRNWDGGDVTLDAPDVLRKTEKSGGSGRAWVLELKPGVNRQYSLTLSGKIALGAAPAVFLPDVRVEMPDSGPMRLERWLAVAGPDLAAEAPVGLADADPAKVLGPWPREAERLRRAGGLLWHVTADEWRLRLRTRLPPARSAAVQLFMTENAALVGDGQRWLHQTTWWLHHEAGADLSLLLPEHAQLLGVAIDNVGVPPLQPAADRLWLPLPGGAAVRTVRLSWVYADGMESLAAPILTGPRLEGVTDGPAVWVVGVPTGYEAAGFGAEAARPTSAAGLDLARAAAQLRIAQFLLGRDNSNQALAVQLIAAQDRFERLTRRAEYQLRASPTGVTGPGGQSLPTWLQELREQDGALLRAPGFEPARVEAGKAGGGDAANLWTANRLPWRISPLEQGRPTFWQAAAAQPAPQVLLIPDTAARNRQAVIHSALLLALLAASWVLWRYFRAVAWPEQLAVLGGVGLLLFSGAWGLPFLLLPGIWLGVRLYHLGRWGRYWFQTQPAAHAAVPTSP